MLEKPRIVEAAVQPTAVIHLTVPRAEIRNVMGPALREVLAAVAAQGATPTGPWFTYHLRNPAETFDFEVGVPVAVPIPATGRVRPGRLPAATVARTVYHGPYEGLAEAWGEFQAWIAAAGRTPASELWECYVAGPESNPDPASFRTELNRPLVR